MLHTEQKVVFHAGTGTYFAADEAIVVNVLNGEDPDEAVARGGEPVSGLLSPTTPLAIVVAGNPMDGFEHYGPFETLDDACRCGEALSGDWSIIPLRR